MSSNNQKLYTHIISGDTQSKDDWEADIKNIIQETWEEEDRGDSEEGHLYAKPGTDESLTLDEACAREFAQCLVEAEGYEE